MDFLKELILEGYIKLNSEELKEIINRRKQAKKEMNRKLGKGRSMDLLDPIAMRFYPCLQYQYGEELSSTNSDEDADVDIYMRNKYGSIYEDSTWC